jgi:hypothetical protein
MNVSGTISTKEVRFEFKTTSADYMQTSSYKFMCVQPQFFLLCYWDRYSFQRRIGTVNAADYIGVPSRWVLLTYNKKGNK